LKAPDADAGAGTTGAPPWPAAAAAVGEIASPAQPARWLDGLRDGLLGARGVQHWGGAIALVAVGLLLPFLLGSFRLELVAKYLCLAFPAVGIVLLWGQTGILSLGQGLFFGMGGYFMAMFLKLEATTHSDSSQALSQFYGSTLPDFMVWNSVETLPWFWKPFQSLPLSLAAILIVPPLTAMATSYFPFRRRVGGVYFSIVTLALASVASIVIIGQQGYTGGVNGITDFKSFAGMDLESPRVSWGLYYVTVALLVGVVLFGRAVMNSRLGKILRAVRDREDRVRFSGYDPAMFKAAIFAVAALFSAIGGALFSLQVGLASPSLVGIVPSVEMVICAAVGGRLSLVGGVVGTVLVYAAKTFFSEHFAQYWLYFIGALFILVVVFLPRGLAGALEQLRGARARRAERA
jgi:urea transport system permease protein